RPRQYQAGVSEIALLLRSWRVDTGAPRPYPLPRARPAMFNGLIKKIFGTKHERQMKKLQPLVSAIAGLEPKMQARSDAELKALTAEFKQQIANGKPLDDLIPEAFAAVREASRRTLGMRHYD